MVYDLRNMLPSLSRLTHQKPGRTLLIFGELSVCGELDGYLPGNVPMIECLFRFESTVCRQIHRDYARENNKALFRRSGAVHDWIGWICTTKYLSIVEETDK